MPGPNYAMVCLFSVYCLAGVAGAEDIDGLIAHWDFEEGSGNLLHDRATGESNGRIHGARWVQSGTGWALSFDGVDDYVDCGDASSLDLRGPLTLQAWVKPTAANRGEPGIAGKFFESYALTYYGNAYFYISSGGNNVSCPTVLNEWRHLAGVFDGESLRIFINGEPVDSRASRYAEVKSGGRFTIGCIFGDPDASDPNLRNTGFFPGLIDDVRVYNRALSASDVARCYNVEAENKGCVPIDAAALGRLKLEPFFYPNEQRAVAAVDFRWVSPVPAGTRAIAELAVTGETRALQSRLLSPTAARGEDEAAFSLEGLPKGTYELRTFLLRPDLIIQAEDSTSCSDAVTTYDAGWQQGSVNLFGGWATYEVKVPAGTYEVAVRAARIYDAAGIQCTVDGQALGYRNLNGAESGGRPAWSRAIFEPIGRCTLTAGSHTLRLEVIPVKVGPDNQTFDTHAYIGAISLSALPTGSSAMEQAERVAFELPFADPEPPVSPTDRVADVLPAPIHAPAYDVSVDAGGAILVRVGDLVFPIESCYSFPDGGFNVFGSPVMGEPPEAAWRVVVVNDSGSVRRIRGAGDFYEIERRLSLEPSRMVIRDTIHNLRPYDLGVITRNRMDLRNHSDASVTQMGNPTLFASHDGVGLALIALSDLYQLRHRTAYADGFAEIRDDHVGISAGATYTLEWAVYPTATADYYDFINQVRADEGLHGYVEGAFSFVPRRDPPSAEFVANRNLAYSSIGCLGKPLDNPATPLEGFEFVEYPKESAALAETFAQTKARFPGMKVMFHVAHSLYICNDPAARFPDSLAIDANGRQMHYGPNSFDYYGRYISKELFEQGWRWWIFYPTPENSFGGAMVSAIETMMKDIGATGMWADGYISGYAKGGYSYDAWDGHSVTIDPKTKQITRKKTCVSYVSLPVLKRCARIIRHHGGILISNGHPGPRSYWSIETITSCETGGGDAKPVSGLHLGRTVTPLGNPSVLRNERDCYRDMLAKLDLGALYFWYGWDRPLTHKTLTEHMYPITFESIHAGTVRGRERIVTKRSGVYGWHGNAEDDAAARDLHAVHLYDARGAETRHAVLTTVEGGRVRSELALSQDQSAVIVRIPIAIDSVSPVNVRVHRYDAGGIELWLTGDGQTRLTLRDGTYQLAKAKRHRVRIGDDTETRQPEAGVLTFAVALKGPTRITLQPR